MDGWGGRAGGGGVYGHRSGGRGGGIGTGEGGRRGFKLPPESSLTRSAVRLLLRFRLQSPFCSCRSAPASAGVYSVRGSCLCLAGDR